MNGSPGKPSKAFQRVIEYFQQQQSTEPPKKAERQFTITISRQHGARGSQVAQEIGRRLSWQVYDRKLVDEIVGDARAQDMLVEAVDEKHKSWMLQCLEAFVGAPTLSEPAYAHRLVKVLLSLAAHGACIIVGRGAGFFLPIKSTLRVGLVAPRKERIKWIASEDQISENEATRQVKQIDHERQMFVKGHFHKDPHEMEHYDLILNSGRFSDAQSADIIVEALARAQVAVQENVLSSN